MENKIALLTSGHPPFDERIYWKFARSLSKNGFNVTIIASTDEIQTSKDDILITGFDGTSFSKNAKIQAFNNYLVEFKPSLIICCEPLPILSAYKYKKHTNNKCVIISDITEWYPLQSTLNLYKGLKRIVKFIQLYIFNIYATNLADHLIIGEQGKAELYKYLAPYKPKTIIGYYPPSELLKYYPSEFNGKTITLAFTGPLSEERGFTRFTEIIKKLSEAIPGIPVTAKIIGKPADQSAFKQMEGLSRLGNVKVEYSDVVPFDLLSENLKNTDICIDLRDKNEVYNRSLPIKIFDCMACGKPVIFSNLRSFYQLSEINEFGYLVEPEDINSAVNKILYYIKNPEKLREDSAKARHLFETKFNWELLEEKLIALVKNLISSV